MQHIGFKAGGSPKLQVNNKNRSKTAIQTQHLELFRKNPGCWDEISLIKFLKNFYIYRKLN